MKAYRNSITGTETRALWRMTLLAAFAVSACSDADAPLEPTTGPAVLAGGGTSAPVNGRILYSVAVNGNLEIFSINPDGSDARQLTFRSGDDQAPAFSPDGKKILFEGNDANSVRQIYLMNADGSRLRQLTAFVYPGGAQHPAWSPDGRQIGFTGHLDGDFDLYVMSANGRNVRVLSGEGADVDDDFHPAWSPDGQRIAFARSAGGTVPQVWLMNADGSGVEQLTQCGANSCLEPAWAPDGSRIAYENRGIGTGTLQVLTPGEVPQTLATNLAIDLGGPVWSPDGAKLAYPALIEGGLKKIVTMNTDGSGFLALSLALGVQRDASWGRGR